MANSTGGAGWRQKSTGFLATIAAVVLVVVLAGGMALGYAIEKNRVKSDKTTKTTTTKKKKTPAKTAGPVVHTKGTVDALSTVGISITPAKGAKENIAITKTTKFVKAGAGTLTDVAAKTRVLFVAKGSYTTASAVMVLPGAAKLGDMVSAADATSMSIGPAAKSVKITITGAKVEKAATAKRSDVTKGVKVVVAAVRKGSGLIATEILIVPNDSPFA
jgi:hypothetical protein